MGTQIAEVAGQTSRHWWRASGAGATAAGVSEIQRLEEENRELTRANKILIRAVGFFGT
jgi:transposase-like protein